jgi:hypothetical protein
MRACWTATPLVTEPDARGLVAVGPGHRHDRDHLAGSGSGRQPRTFVPVGPETAAPTGEETSGPAGITTDTAVARAASISPATGTGGRVPGTWWLWGDPEPWPDL